MAHGYRALIKLLQNYRRKYGCQTIADFISRWAPRTENNTSGYISRVCQEMQVPTTYVPNVEDKTTMCAFAAAISQVENGVPAVMADVEKDGHCYESFNHTFFLLCVWFGVSRM